MSISLGVVMDPIASIKPHKDSTLAMLLEAQKRGWALWYMRQADLFCEAGRAAAHMQRIEVFDDSERWFELRQAHTAPLDELQVLLMRKDPPFDIEYVFSTYLLELAEQRGTLVVNRPQALRDANEKMSTLWFPQCTPPTLVTSSATQLHAFLDEHRDIIVKPLDGMGGHSIFRLAAGDPNTNVVFETMTTLGQRLTMAQRFIPEITAGDKRILLIDGEPVPHALARVPAEGESRGNLAAGASAHGVKLNERDRWICNEVGPALREKGLIFVGLDVIGDYLTEINVTSPTGIREIDTLFNTNVSARLIDALAARLA